MPEAANEIVIDRSVEDVFAFLADAENDKQWRPGVLELERVSGSGVGTRYRQVVQGPGGRRIPADLEITDYRPNELIGFRATAGPVRPRGRYRLGRADGGTRVRFELEADVRGLKRLMAPAVKATMRSEVGALANLKRVLEETAAT
jgi:uncharacterized protein YndB with AHSA1/START domain